MPAISPPLPGNAPEIVPGQVPKDGPRLPGPEIVEDPDGPQTWPGWRPPEEELPPGPDRAPDPGSGRVPVL